MWVIFYRNRDKRFRVLQWKYSFLADSYFLGAEILRNEKKYCIGKSWYKFTVPHSKLQEEKFLRYPVVQTKQRANDFKHVLHRFYIDKWNLYFNFQLNKNWGHDVGMYGYRMTGRTMKLRWFALCLVSRWFLSRNAWRIHKIWWFMAGFSAYTQNIINICTQTPSFVYSTVSTAAGQISSVCAFRPLRFTQ